MKKSRREMKKSRPPAGIVRPQRETIDAMREARAANLKKFSSVDDLMADLHADD